MTEQRALFILFIRAVRPTSASIARTNSPNVSFGSGRVNNHLNPSVNAGRSVSHVSMSCTVTAFTPWTATDRRITSSYDSPANNPIAITQRIIGSSRAPAAAETVSPPPGPVWS